MPYSTFPEEMLVPRTKGPGLRGLALGLIALGAVLLLSATSLRSSQAPLELEDVASQGSSDLTWKHAPAIFHRWLSVLGNKVSSALFGAQSEDSSKQHKPETGLRDTKAAGTKVQGLASTMRNWRTEHDPATGKTVYMNSATGEATLQSPWILKGARRKNIGYLDSPKLAAEPKQGILGSPELQAEPEAGILNTPELNSAATKLRALQPRPVADSWLKNVKSLPAEKDPIAASWLSSRFLKAPEIARPTSTSHSKPKKVYAGILDSPRLNAAEVRQEKKLPVKQTALDQAFDEAKRDGFRVRITKEPYGHSAYFHKTKNWTVKKEEAKSNNYFDQLEKEENELWLAHHPKFVRQQLQAKKAALQRKVEAEKARRARIEAEKAQQKAREEAKFESAVRKAAKEMEEVALAKAVKKAELEASIKAHAKKQRGVGHLQTGHVRQAAHQGKHRMKVFGDHQLHQSFDNGLDSAADFSEEARAEMKAPVRKSMLALENSF